VADLALWWWSWAGGAQIVDFALAHNKCFAVVPCCVFPEQFPDRYYPPLPPTSHHQPTLTRGTCGSDDRRTKDGRLVVVTDDFIRYLMERDPRIQLAYVRTVLAPYPARGGPALTRSPLPPPQSNSWRWREGTRWCTCSPDLEPNTPLLLRSVHGRPYLGFPTSPKTTICATTYHQPTTDP
jgi:hypothetical protein